MPKPKNSIDRLAVIRGHKLRRDIFQAAQEAHAMGKLVSPVGLSKQLKAPLGTISYHVKELKKVEALELFNEISRRGASEHIYGINEDFLAEITDAVALDRIAEFLDDEAPGDEAHLDQLAEIIRATGRPVGA